MAATIDTLELKDTKIPLIFEKSENLPIFNLQLIFKNSGSMIDGEKNGLTSLTSKILNEGTKKDGAIIFAGKLENKAISLHTSNGFETFAIEVSCLSSEYNEAMKLLNQLLKDPNLTDDTLSKIKTLQISKLKQQENDFDDVAKKNLSKLIWKNTLLENSNSGSIESLKTIELDDIQKHLEKIFNLDNLIIVVGGKINLETFKRDIIATAKLLKKQGETTTPKIIVTKKTGTKKVKKNTEQAYIYFGSDFKIDYNSNDAYKAKVASFILGGSGFGSRLMEEIRVKNGLAYSAYGYTSINKSHSYFTGYLQTKIENEEKAKELVIKTINDFIENGATIEELESAKKFLSGSEPLRTETFSQRLGLAFNLFYKELDQDYPKKELEMINSLTLKEINDFIKSHKEISNLSFSIVTK
ncbi:MAG: insulinase family protein [Epsilonproteobacteria bacterium]|nr:insulinase family protein [Campylobacterota bacterium]